MFMARCENYSGVSKHATEAFCVHAPKSAKSRGRRIENRERGSIPAVHASILMLQSRTNIIFPLCKKRLHFFAARHALEEEVGGGRRL